MGGREAGSRCFQPQPRETFEDDAGQIVPVADEVGERADEQRFFDEARHDVFIGAPAPKERGERDVDDDQRRCDKADFAA